MTEQQSDNSTPDVAVVADPEPLLCEGVDCTEAVEKLYTYLDGQCDSVDRETIKSHLDGCSPCLSAFDFHAELQLLVQDRCKSEMPEGLRDKVLGALLDLEFDS